MTKFTTELLRSCIYAKHCLTLLVCVLLLLTPNAQAYSSYGLGNLNCETYLEKRGEDQQNSTLSNTSYIHAYLSGYLTAGNMMKGLVDDGASDVSINIHRFVQWLDAKCSEDESTNVSVALEEFWVEAAKARELIKKNSRTSP